MNNRPEISSLHGSPEWSLQTTAGTALPPSSSSSSVLSGSPPPPPPLPPPALELTGFTVCPGGASNLRPRAHMPELRPLSSSSSQGDATSNSMLSVTSDRGPGFRHVMRLAQRLVEVGRRRYIHNSEVEEIVALWGNLHEVDKGPVNHPPRYRGKESFNTRCNVRFGDGCGTWPDASRLMEAIFIHLCVLHPSSKREGSYMIKRWTLVLRDYGTIRRTVIEHPTLVTRTKLQLFAVTRTTLSEWYNRWTLRLERNFLGEFISNVQPLPHTSAAATSSSSSAAAAFTPTAFTPHPVPRTTAWQRRLREEQQRLAMERNELLRQHRKRNFLGHVIPSVLPLPHTSAASTSPAASSTSAAAASTSAASTSPAAASTPTAFTPHPVPRTSARQRRLREEQQRLAMERNELLRQPRKRNFLGHIIRSVLPLPHTSAASTSPAAASNSPDLLTSSSTSLVPTAAPQEEAPVATAAANEDTPQDDGPSPSTSHPPSRMTVWRRKQREKQDKKTLQESQASPGLKPGDPCDICGYAKTLQQGHAFYKGQFYCTMAEGPGAKSAAEWLHEQEAPEAEKIPRTTIYNMKKRFDRKESQPPPAKQRKSYKIRVCQHCGQPKQKDYGHSQHNSEHFCALYEGKSVELWLAERRAKK